MRPTVTDGVAWSVSRSVILSVTIMSPVEMAEPMEMPFGLWSWVGPRKHVLDGGPNPCARAILSRKDAAHCKV